MNPETVMSLMSNAIQMMLKLSGPLLLGGLAIGIMIGVFQAVTQIQEMTLTFIPKILVTALILLVTFPWMLQIMIDYTSNLFRSVPDLIR